jgi:lipoprotein-anchoring transpeptidase ErfK/SrfK
VTGGLPGESFYYLEDVPWVLYFDQARSLHGTYWHNRFGTPTSHGCVNMSIADARWFYDWASEDTWVYVWDPSGNTPTDPAVYGPGAY